MHNDDERDFEEEADNLRTMREQDFPDEAHESDEKVGPIEWDLRYENLNPDSRN